MFPPNILAFRHSSARPQSGERDAVAPNRSARQSWPTGSSLPWQGPFSLTSYPSLLLRSGPSQAGPRPFDDRQSNADCVTDAKFCFESRWFGVVSHLIKTNKRGSTKCASHLSFSLFLPRRWQAACRTLRPAGLQGLQQVLWSPMQPKATSLQALSSAVLPVRRPVASKWACRPASRATDLIPACGRGRLSQRPSGQFARVAFSIFPRLERTKETPCSRKS